MSNALFLLLVLACPLMMVFMMRGMHGGHGHGGSAEKGDAPGPASHHEHVVLGAPGELPLDELKRRRDELDREIVARETPDAETAPAEPETLEPVA